MNYGKVAEFYELGQNVHDFYRCIKCGRVFTREYEQSQFVKMEAGTERYVHCRSLKYSPDRPIAVEWIRPDVLLYTFKVVVARVVAPWLQKHGHISLWKLAMWAASNRATR